MNQPSGPLGGKVVKKTTSSRTIHVHFLSFSVIKYHNQSSVVLQDKYTPYYDNKKVQMKKTITDEINSKLPTFDPKTANKSHIVFGTERGDFNKQPSGMTSPRMPPGGRSNIVFG